jgi:hypothetical protein
MTLLSGRESYNIESLTIGITTLSLVSNVKVMSLSNRLQEATESTIKANANTLFNLMMNVDDFKDIDLFLFNALSKTFV